MAESCESMERGDALDKAVEKFLTDSQYTPPWESAGGKWAAMLRTLNLALCDYRKVLSSPAAAVESAPMTDGQKPLTDQELGAVERGEDWRDVVCHGCGQQMRVLPTLRTFTCDCGRPMAWPVVFVNTPTGPRALERLVTEVRRLRALVPVTVDVATVTFDRYVGEEDDEALARVGLRRVGTFTGTLHWDPVPPSPPTTAVPQLTDEELAEMVWDAGQAPSDQRLDHVTYGDRVQRLAAEVRSLRAAAERSRDLIAADTETIRRLRSDAWLDSAAKEILAMDRWNVGKDYRPDVLAILRKHRDGQP